MIAFGLLFFVFTLVVAGGKLADYLNDLESRVSALENKLSPSSTDTDDFYF